MLNRISIYLFIALSAGLISSSCSNTKFLADNQLLYTGKKTVIISDSGKFTDRNARQTIESVTGFQPNNALGGKRLLPPIGLWTYNYRKPKEGKKPRWLHRTFAKEPVLISTVDPGTRCRKLESELFGNGYFHSRVSYVLDTARNNKHKSAIIYYIKPGSPFRYHEISFSPPVDEVDSLINNAEKDLKISPDDIFSLEAVKSEAKRISLQVLEKGYFYFNPSMVKWTADTNNVPNQIDLRIGKNNELMQNAGKKFFIGDITVRISVPADSPGLFQNEDTLLFDGLNIASQGMYLKPEVLARSIYFRKGETYSAMKHQQTLTHLNSYGVFKFINLQYVPSPDTTINQMDALIDLTLMKNISLDLETNVVTKSTGFAGPGFEAKLAHGNVAKGANRLQLKLNGGVEWQMSGSSNSTLGQVSYNAGVSTSLIFPRIIKPARLLNTNRFNLPQTTISLGFEFLNKIQYYRMSSSNLGFGYQWKKPDKITHMFSPVWFNSVELLETTPEFDSILNENPYIKKSFEEQFIAGMKYDFIYDNSMSRQTNGFYFQAGISTSGNIIDLYKRATSSTEERPYTVINSVYSQFMKFTTDIRYYRKFQDKSLVFRIYSGLGIPYSNSVVMPYVEQFYSGGSNSIRAFVARSLGPGALIPDETSDIIDQTGDIKLEGNMEYRFKLSKVLHGALFVDAGNVWLLNPDESRPDAEFHFNTFASQLYMGTGIGLRFDFNFFILRTDFGMPLRTGYLIEDSNWVRKTRDMIGGTVFNLAIGYPF
jgi:outer membrane protein insertion porin family